MRDGRVSVSTTASKDGVVKDLAYYGFEDVDPSAIEAATGRVLIDARKNLAEMVLDARNNMAELRLRAVCIRVADECVNHFLMSGETNLTMDLKALQ